MSSGVMATRRGRESACGKHKFMDRQRVGIDAAPTLLLPNSTKKGTP